MARASGSPSPQSLSNSVTSFFSKLPLGLGRDVSFHDGDDVAAEFLARDVARKITLVSRKGACGRGGNRERRPGHLQKFDQVVRGHRLLRSPPYDHAAMARKWQRRRRWVLRGRRRGPRAPSRLRRSRDSERAVAGRRGGGAKPAG